MEQEMNTMNEMEATSEVVSLPEEEKKVWYDLEGNEVSMSQFIREQFTKFNKGRKEIAEEFDINYRTVYGATVNMENDAEPSSRGRGVVNPKIAVTADNKIYTTKVTDEGAKYFLDNEEIDEDSAHMLETVEKDRNTWIKEMVAAGMSRGDVAKALDLSYGVVYGLTKENEGTRQKYVVELPNGETMPRSEYIRARVAEGVSKADVANELNVDYSVVWQATKKDKTDADKYNEAVAALRKFADKIPEGDKMLFDDAIVTLESIKIPVPVEAEEEVAEVVAE